MLQTDDLDDIENTEEMICRSCPNRTSNRIVYIFQPQSKQLQSLYVFEVLWLQLQTIIWAKRLCRRWPRAFHIKAVIIGLRLPSNYFMRVEWHGRLSNRHTSRGHRWRARRVRLCLLVSWSQYSAGYSWLAVAPQPEVTTTSSLAATGQIIHLLSFYQMTCRIASVEGLNKNGYNN